MSLHRTAALIALAALPGALPAAAETDGAKAYYHWMQQCIDGLRADMDAVTRAADVAAERYCDGDSDIVTLGEPGFAWDVELVTFADSLGYRVVEVPVVWEDHPESTVHPVWTAVELGRALVSMRRRASALDRTDRAAEREPRRAPTTETGE